MKLNKSICHSLKQHNCLHTFQVEEEEERDREGDGKPHTLIWLLAYIWAIAPLHPFSPSFWLMLKLVRPLKRVWLKLCGEAVFIPGLLGSGVSFGAWPLLKTTYIRQTLPLPRLILRAYSI